MADSKELSRGEVLRLWGPLAFTWIVMGVEAPMLTALIARLPDSTVNLAAYGIAISLLLFCEAPVLVIVSASIALVQDRDSMQKFWNFCVVHTVAVATVMVLLSRDFIFKLTIARVMELPPGTPEQIKSSLLILSPVPIAVAHRRFFQGILIRSGNTRSVAWGTVGRISAIILSAAGFFRWSDLTGVEIGSAALLCGVIAEAVFCRWMAAEAVDELRKESAPDPTRVLHHLQIAKFYYPLAISTIIVLTVQPIVCAFLSHSKLPLESLALFPVLNSLTIIFRSCGLAYQETAVALLGRDPKAIGRLKECAKLIGFGASTALAAIVLTPLSRLWFESLGGLRPEMVELSRLPAAILVLSPLVTTWVCFERAACIARGETKLTALSGAVELGGVALCMFIGVELVQAIGIVVSSVALLLAGAASGWLLTYLRTAGTGAREGSGIE